MEPIVPESTSSQTVGPYYAIGFTHIITQTLAGEAATGEHVTIVGTLSDGNGNPIPDAILEFWQAAPNGVYKSDETFAPHPSSADFAGFARVSTLDNGRFQLHTVKPGPVPYIDGRTQAPHIVVLLLMRGLLRHIVTRVYFADDPHNPSDPILALVPEHRRSTLVSSPINGQPSLLQWNISMQGPHETVFFSC